MAARLKPLGRTTRLAAVFGFTVSLGCRTSEPSDSQVREPSPEPPGLAAAEPPSPPTPPAAPVVTPASEQAHARAQTAATGGTLAPNELVHFQPIDDPSADALTAFHRALAALRSGHSNRHVRVVIYGSSSVATDRYPGYLREYMQARFGDGGIGFVALVPLWRWHRHDAVEVKASRHWTIEHAQKKTGRLDGRYGLLGASAFTTAKRAFARLATRRPANDLDQVELYFLNQPQGGSFTIETPNGAQHTVQTRADHYSGGTVSMSAPALPLNVRTAGDGEVRLFGVRLERSHPGVIVDSLGLGGSRSANHLEWDFALWKEQFERHLPDLYMFAYGANEAVDEDEPIEIYEANLDRVLERFSEVAPNASCVVIGPVEFSMLDESERWVVRPRIRAIAAIQHKVAHQHGCGFWDLQAVMGGAGGMERWARADPPLAKGDRLHLTALGYVHVGRMLTDALMAKYDAADDK
jgi:lysophospholipase L1-like esterase